MKYIYALLVSFSLFLGFSSIFADKLILCGEYTEQEAFDLLKNDLYENLTRLNFVDCSEVSGKNIVAALIQNLKDGRLSFLRLLFVKKNHLTDQHIRDIRYYLPNVTVGYFESLTNVSSTIRAM